MPYKLFTFVNIPNRYNMPTVNFLYRSSKEKASLNLRLLFRKDGKDFVLAGNSKIEVTRGYWKEYHDKKKNLDVVIRNLQQEIKGKLADLENHILSSFEQRNSLVDKTWLKNTIDVFYNPVPESPEIPTDLLGYIDYYLEYRKNELELGGVKRIKVTKNKMDRLQKLLGKPILLKEINEDFKQNYVKFSEANSYSKNTQQRELVLIKTICFHARHLGIQTHYQLDGIKLPKQVVKHIYLNTQEIDSIKKVEFEHDYLDNARDWLLISCFTGQRVSDFMRFSPEMIRIEEGKYLLEFKQKKTKKLMTIPLIPEAREILKKRNGNFPRPISDQRYNTYIKTVAEKAGLTEKVKGKKRKCIAPEGIKPTKSDFRDVMGNCQKWELVTSHIGRRSFATNYYGKVPTTYLINITGHGSEKIFLSYIKKSNKDLALDAYNYFE